MNTFLRQEIRAGLNFERHGAALFFHAPGKILQPVPVQAKDVVGKPQMFRTVSFLQQFHLKRDFGGISQLKGIPKNRLCAPVATERASAAGN